MAGFTDSLVTNQSSAPIAVTALPDGRAVVLQKGGAVRIIQNGVLLPTAALTKAVCASSERGMLGFAADPQFTANGLVYIYYTRVSAAAPGGCVNRVSRFTMSGNTISNASEVVLLDNIGSPAGNHNGGDVAVGNDGYLYVSVGDGGCDPRDDSGCAGQNDAAQDATLLNGKILRIDRITGAPAAGNPFTGPSTATCRVRGNTPSTPATVCQEIFAYGLRNPWRFAFDPNTGATRFYINDVGQGTREEVDLGILGANYGWPAREGQCAQGQNPVCMPPAGNLGYTQPLTDYQHGVTGDYITGGAFVPNGAWSSAYDGGYLFADGDPGRIFFKPAVGNTNYNVPFVTGVAGVSDIEFVMEPAGWALYYVSPALGEVRKVTYNTAPAASPGNLAFAPVTPSVRVFDSRSAGGLTGPLRAGTSRLINLVASQGAHRAALVNLTFISPGSNGYVAAWQPRTTRPSSSNINGQAGNVAANASVVPVDADGNVIIFTNVTAHLVVDVLGFFDVTAGGQSQAGRFLPVNPVRAVDTRNPAGTGNVYTRAVDGLDNVVNVPIVGGDFGIEAANISVALIVTGLAGPGPAGGNVVVMPHGGVVPTSSNVNTNGSGDVRANLVVVPLGADGSIDLRLRTTANVLVDVLGSFTDSGSALATQGTYVPVAPTRVVDTRVGLAFGRLTAGGWGSANPATVPEDALGVTQNIVIVQTSGAGFITAYPTGLVPVPDVSNGNSTAAGQTRSAMAITMLGSGSSTYFASMATDVVVDVTGYFAGPLTF
ncbi:MAG: PQQ-dependent sugar dehydrogenase [Actinomycetota bacterium]|nr:PQQ-dependent sugar dehydrogenase [Actinomycetota bacterium]